MRTGDRDAGAAAAALLPPPAAHLVQAGGVAPVAFDVDDDGPQHRLPNDHPRWNRDAITISQRARAMFARLKPVAVRVVHFWEHRVRNIAIGNRTLSVDASGSYKLQ